MVLSKVMKRWLSLAHKLKDISSLQNEGQNTDKRYKKRKKNGSWKHQPGCVVMNKCNGLIALNDGAWNHERWIH